MSPVTFANLQNVDNAHDRYVRVGNGQFKPANEGGWKDKVVTWLNEKFRPGLIKQQNREAYQAAKEAFRLETGEFNRADRLFNAKIEAGARFSPADLKSAWHQVAFSAAEAGTIEAEIRSQLEGGGSSDPLEMEDISVGARSCSVATQFIKDAHRAPIVINGETVDRHNPIDSAFSIAARHGISDDDMAGLSKFLNQASLSEPTKILSGRPREGADPARATYPRPGGDRLEVKADLSPKVKYEVESLGMGRFAVKISAGGPILECDLVSEFGRPVQNASVDHAKSRCSLSLSLTVGPGRGGELTLISLDQAQRNVTLFETFGSQLI